MCDLSSHTLIYIFNSHTYFPLVHILTLFLVSGLVFLWLLSLPASSAWRIECPPFSDYYPVNLLLLLLACLPSSAFFFLVCFCVLFSVYRYHGKPEFFFLIFSRCLLIFFLLSRLQTCATACLSEVMCDDHDDLPGACASLVDPVLIRAIRSYIEL